MTTQDATLIAAVIAAIASVLRLLFDRSAEERTNFRVLLQPIVAELGESLHGIVATSYQMGRSNSEESYKNWLDKAESERNKLEKLRPLLRYPLWGIDEGLRVLIRLPGWTQHAKGQPERLRSLNKRATRLRAMLDVVILRCYINGRPPSVLEQLQVNIYAWHCRQAFNKRSSGPAN